MPFHVQVFIDGDLRVKARIPDDVDDGVVHYVAACPPTRRYSRVGSGLPFPNHEHAFQNTPNRGKHLIVDGFLTVHVLEPNSFYAGMGKVLVPPTLYVSYSSGGKQTERAIGLCSAPATVHAHTSLLAWPRSRRDATFYKTFLHLPVRCQEQILRDGAAFADPLVAARACEKTASGKTKVTPEAFWGLRPPV